jgi:hypothetical protein
MLIMLGVSAYLFTQNSKIKKDLKSEKATVTSLMNTVNNLKKDLNKYPAPSENIIKEPGYLYINEWSKKLKLGGNSDKVGYRIVTQVGEESVVVFIKPEVIQANTAEVYTCDSIGAGITRTKDANLSTMRGVISDFATDINGYYYYEQGAPGRCSDTSDYLNNLQGELLQATKISNLSDI